MYPHQLTPQRIMVEVEKVIQSNHEWLMEGEFHINLIHCHMPVGGTYKKGIGSLEAKLEKQKCIIQIKNKNMTCCARSLVVAKARVDNHPKWNSIRQGRSIQAKLAMELCQSAGVSPLKECGPQEWRKFQDVLPDYQITVISAEFFNSIVFEGQGNPAHPLIIYHARNHYAVITSMTAFQQRTYYCTGCHKGYSNKAEHRCSQTCPSCRQVPRCVFENWVHCNSCNRYFFSESCLARHRRVGTCKYVERCKDCGKTIYTHRKHRCGWVYCQMCKMEMPYDHHCYIHPLKSEGKKRQKKRDLYIFYDFECMLNENNEHVPNLCVAHRVCADCMEKPMMDSCENKCGRERKVFNGEHTLSDFCKWLFDGSHMGAICMAHNNQSYDLYFIMDYIHQQGIKPELVPNGQKIMSMQACGMKFIDSLNFFPTSLSKLPKMFGLDELAKGYFPHLFSVEENQNYIGPKPDMKYYNPDGMYTKQREEFEAWYKAQPDNFDFQEDLVKYCISDVDILQRCCGTFRKIFMKHAEGIDPFVSSITIASACNEVYRKLFLEENQIPILPVRGYQSSDQQSGIALCWMDWYAKETGHYIQHSANDGEVSIGVYKVDGADCNSPLTLLEFQGCFFHGCESCYPDRSTINPVNGLKMSDLYEKTMLKTKALQALGYTVIEMWECDFRRKMKDNNELANFYRNYERYEPLNPREGFMGGRTNAIRLFAEATEGSQIRYVDYTSLYPWACKTRHFPIGHPVIFKKGINEPDEDTDLEGLIKCKVLPPRRLFHPVLAYRARNKLLFPLCRTCAEEGNQGSCTHDDPNDRALTGVWVSFELAKAEDMGYEIMEWYEIWHFEETTQYNPQTREGGLFAQYIDLFLRLKQQASGWPSWVTTEEDKDHYIQMYEEKEGIHLNPSEIEFNEGLRSLAKLMLNVSTL
jgi:hypothetical protein